MPRTIAFLRGINLGKRRLPMSVLKARFEELGFVDVETFIASGNVIFSSKARNGGHLETRIASHLRDTLGYQVDTFVRTAEEVIALGKANVFPEGGQDGITVHVCLLHQKLGPTLAQKLTAIQTEEDEFRVIGREYYWLCRVRTSDSKVWTRPDIKALRLPTTTMRNLTSIRKLIAKHLA